MNKKLTEEQKFEQMLQQDEEAIMNGEYQGHINIIPPQNASLTDRLKYQLCQRILSYIQDYDLIEEELAVKLDLNIDQTRDILFGYTKRLELDDLAKKVDQLFNFRNKYYYSFLTPQPMKDVLE